jgi:hypothetical protein
MPRGCPIASLEERFLKKCVEDGDCWRWTANTYLNGYGQLLPRVWGTGYAHQWACHQWNDSPLPVEKDMCVKHSCDNRWCVNPAHLSYGTLAENREEMYERNPTALGRILPTEQELAQLRQMIAENTPRREMMRKIGHSRGWIDRVRRDYFPPSV